MICSRPVPPAGLTLTGAQGTLIGLMDEAMVVIEEFVESDLEQVKCAPGSVRASTVEGAGSGESAGPGERDQQDRDLRGVAPGDGSGGHREDAEHRGP